MSKSLNQLSARTVAGKLEPGRYSDGGNLYLNVTAAGSKSWQFIYRTPKRADENGNEIKSKQREMGLGTLEKVSLQSARELAAHARDLLGRGIDPIDERERLENEKAIEAVKAAELKKADTFGTFALKLLNGYVETDKNGKSHRVPSILEGLRNEKHKLQWTSTLQDYAKPIWSLPLDAIGVNDIIKCVGPIWTTKHETASRVRGRIEKVLSAAIARGLRQPPNPAMLRGNIDALLPKQAKLARGHHAALPYRQMATFWERLSELDSVSALAVRFAILTAARSGEVRGATWSEIDMANRTWTVPPSRMKAAREHRQRLSDPVLALLEDARKFRQTWQPDELVFPSIRDRVQLSDMAMAQCLRGLNWPDKITVHGFRSTFRDWSAEETSYPNEVCEMALAHTVSNAVERAYRRGDLFEKRRALMDEWGAYVTSGIPKG